MQLLPGPHISQDLSVANLSASVVEQWRSKYVVNVVRDRLRRVLLSINTLIASVLRTLHHRIDHAADVQARYLDLTLTPSELLVGCGKATIRYPLCDLAAYIEDSCRRQLEPSLDRRTRGCRTTSAATPAGEQGRGPGVEIRASRRTTSPATAAAYEPPPLG